MLQNPKHSMERIILFLLTLSIGTSAIVTVEPAPTDVLLILTICIAALFNQLYFNNSIMLGFFLVMSFLAINMLSFFWVVSPEKAMSYVAITIYMAFMWSGVVGLGGVYGVKLLQLITKVYFYIGLATALLALVTYFHLIPYYEAFFMFDRVKLLFKDPNVLGPYLVFPALYAIAKFEEKGKVLYFISFFMITSGIIVCFSRAAWLNLFVSIIVFLVLLQFKRQRKTMRLIWMFLVLGIVAFTVIYTNDTLKTQFTERLGLQQYDTERFNSQKNASIIGITDPLGKGPGQSELLLEIAPHNLFARLLIENGLLGVLTFVVFVIASLVSAFQSMKQSAHFTYYYMIVMSAIIGQCVNSLFIDTLHWRHFWLLLALAWIPYKRGGYR